MHFGVHEDLRVLPSHFGTSTHILMTKAHHSPSWLPTAQHVGIHILAPIGSSWLFGLACFSLAHFMLSLACSQLWNSC